MFTLLMMLKSILKYVFVVLFFLLFGFYGFKFYQWYVIRDYERKSVDAFLENKGISVLEKNFFISDASLVDYIAVLEIPKIHLRRGLVSFSSRFNNVRYNVQMLSPVRMPNERGNLILASHSGNSRVAFFDKLHLLDLGDEVYVYYHDIKYRYKVVNKYEIKKNGRLVLPDILGEYNLVLTTCSKNKGKQLVVIASR